MSQPPQALPVVVKSLFLQAIPVGRLELYDGEFIHVISRHCTACRGLAYNLETVCINSVNTRPCREVWSPRIEIYVSSPVSKEVLSL